MIFQYKYIYSLFVDEFHSSVKEIAASHGFVSKWIQSSDRPYS
jgi:hypothetical protein